MKLVIRIGAAMTLASSLSACATVTRGTTQAFTVESTPPAAAVKTSTGFTCPATPCTFKLPRKEAFEVTVSKPGYKPATAQVLSKVAGAGAAGLAGNVIAGGIIGMGIDATSGAMKDLLPNPLHVTLEAEAPVETADAQPPIETVVEPVADTPVEPAAEPAAAETNVTGAVQ